jgi:hypothetical protein
MTSTHCLDFDVILKGEMYHSRLDEYIYLEDAILDIAASMILYVQIMYRYKIQGDREVG